MKKGWKNISFGELGRVFNGNSISEADKKAHFVGLENGVPYIGTKDVSFEHEVAYESGVKIPHDKTAAFKLAPANTVLVCAEGGSAGRKIAHTDREIYFGNKLFAVCPSPPISSRLIFYYCLSDDFTKQFKGSMAGLIGGVSINKFKELSVPVPPLPEQHRIVTILDEAFAGLATAKATAEKNLQNARALFESHLQSVFSQRGEGWVETTLGDLCSRITKGSSPKWQGISYVNEPGVLFVTSENVGLHRLIMDKTKYVEEAFNLKERKSILRNGDVLSNLVGASIGRTAVYDLDDGANVNQAVCVLSCNPAKLDNYFLSYLLNSPVFRQVLHDNEVNNARANISLSLFRGLAVQLPPLSVQKEIVRGLDSVGIETQHLAAIYQSKLAALEALKNSLLHQAFSGEL
jgi:type I restriction enzyme S subunit